MKQLTKEEIPISALSEKIFEAVWADENLCKDGSHHYVKMYEAIEKICVEFAKQEAAKAWDDGYYSFRKCSNDSVGEQLKDMEQAKQSFLDSIK